ncbi:MAG: ribonuclease P protein component [Verrucomicrobia bacterium]|nr:ribonuclease P protein component [Verrucomicrobiota bacterium]
MPAGPTPHAPLRLSRACRLKQGRDFTRLKTQGRRLVCGCLILNWLPSGGDLPCRLGVVTGRKIGGAVVRSRARRLLREVWRRNQRRFAQPLDVVLVARQSIAEMKLADVEGDYLTALRRARLLPADEPGPTNSHA